MPMRATTVRFSDDLWSLLDEEAGRQGISAAQFVRDATIMRIGALAGRRGDPEAVRSIEDVASGALRGRRSRSGTAPPQVRDPERLDELRATGLLDSPPVEAFDRITRTAARAIEAPLVLVSLVDEDRQFIKSCIGADIAGGSDPLEYSVCQYGLGSTEPLVIHDTTTDPRLADNLGVTERGVLAYAGAPLISERGNVLGMLCAADFKTRTWTSDEVETLVALAGAVTAQIELTSTR